MIRKATPADVPAAAALVASAYATTFQPILGEAASGFDAAHFRERFSRDLAPVEVLDEDGVAGLLFMKEGHIAMLFTARPGRGHGAALLEHAEGNGARSLETFAANAGARRFYERAGWRVARAYARAFAGAEREFMRYEKLPAPGPAEEAR